MARDGDILDPIIGPEDDGGIKDPYIKILRNVHLLTPHPLNPTFALMKLSFFASKVYITIEEEEIRGEKKLATGEMRVRWKKRRKIELELPFFDKFNNYIDEYHCGYREFEICINAPTLFFQYTGKTKGHLMTTEMPNTYPFYDPDIKNPIETIDVIVKDKKVEFLNNHYARKIIHLTLVERYNWYAT